MSELEYIGFLYYPIKPVPKRSGLSYTQQLYGIALDQLFNRTGLKKTNNPDGIALYGNRLSGYGQIRAYLETLWYRADPMHQRFNTPDPSWLKHLVEIVEARIDAGAGVLTEEEVVEASKQIELRIVQQSLDNLQFIKNATDFG